MTKQTVIMQGDCVLVKVDPSAVPADAVARKRNAKGIIPLLEGETGNTHGFSGADTLVFDTPAGVTFVVQPTPDPLVHEEHGTFDPSDPATWRQVYQVEESRERIQQVID